MNQQTLAISTYLLSSQSLAAFDPQRDTELPPRDKGAYSLFNPTPRELWRPMSADRPDFTESPSTVDAGAVQIEMSFIDYSQNGDEDAWAYAPTNLKIGLLNNMDLQIVFTPYATADDGTQTTGGLGDTQLRLKVNLWGNDGGKTALGIMPFIKVPTAGDDLGNDRVEGGVIFPFAAELSEGVGLGLMFETDFVYDADDDDYDAEFITTSVLGLDVAEKTGVYIEGIGISSTDSDVDFRGILGIGGTYELTKNMILDAGINIGLTGEADEINLFTGITVRF